MELGAGMGLPSLVAASYTSAVVCSDYLTDALIFAKKNAELNGILSIRYECIDWRSYNSDQRYRLILASDIAYEKRF